MRGPPGPFASDLSWPRDIGQVSASECSQDQSVQPATVGARSAPASSSDDGTGLTVDGSEKPADPANYSEDDADDPQNVDVQQQSENQQDDAKDDHEDHVLSP
jgi:hypothetical protein